MSHYEMTTMANGLRVITENMPSVRSVSVGCWVGTGTRDEYPSEAGASHFLEHLLFKGTDELSAREISDTLDRMGAMSNAFTSQEDTCYWARMLDEYLPTVLRILAGMLQQPAFRPEDIDSERNVVFEEINRNEDDHQHSAAELFNRSVFEGHPMERPVLGTRQSIEGITRGDLVGYWQRRYTPHSVVIAVSGAAEHAEVLELAEQFFGEWSGDAVPLDSQEHIPTTSVNALERDTEQVHLFCGGAGLTHTDEQLWAAKTLMQVMGGGMSSRLFTTVREERGLAYSIYGFHQPFTDTGLWGIGVGTTPKNTDEVMTLINEQLDSVLDDGITESELDKVKSSSRGALALHSEAPQSRMMHLGQDETLGLPHYSTDELLQQIMAVTLSDVADVAQRLFAGDRTLAAVGPIAETDLRKHVA